METRFEPEDPWLGNEGQDGIDMVDEALSHFTKLDLDRIITSRDPGIDQARNRLRVKNMPPGWDSWQLPVYLLQKNKAMFFFLQVAQPGAVLPAHKHDVPQVRMILWGHVLFNGTLLGAGDWIYTPAGEKGVYSLSVAGNPGGTAGITYAY
jgi:hypothetical protein